LAYHVAC